MVGLLPALNLYNAGSVSPRSVRGNDCARFRSDKFVKDDMPDENICSGEGVL